MTHIITLIILILTLQGCSQPNNITGISKPLPHLSLKETKRLANDQDLMILYGDIASHTTEGADYLEKLVKDSSYSSNQWVDIYLSILTRNEFYHLHNDAGRNLAYLKSLKEIISRQDSLPLNTIAYILSRMVYSTSQVTDSRPQELSIDQINSFMALLNEKRIDNSVKVYFLQALYSCSFKSETGLLIDSLVRNTDIDSSVLEHNTNLFERYKNLKPQFEQLDRIHTWKEMDQNVKEIDKFLRSSDPLLFYQILGFNPSTVLDSKEFCKLKKETLLKILTKDYNGEQLFYASYINAFKPELLNYDFYTIRFLQEIMTREEFENFRNTFRTD